MILNLENKDLDTNIYRIISLERLLELFIIQENTLVRPKLWNDPFENFILGSKVESSGGVIDYTIDKRIFGQCWTFHEESDAMWRIYSPNKNGLRVKTTGRKLYESFRKIQRDPPDMSCLGKVEYLTNKELRVRANTIFYKTGIFSENIFESLLLKRKAFTYENEVRLLFTSWDEGNLKDEIYRYGIDPHKLIDQIMVDPRSTNPEFETLRTIIEKATGYKGRIERSNLYSPPEDMVLNSTNLFD
jgi:hypothetical protein